MIETGDGGPSRPLWFALALAVTAVLPYLSGLGNELVWDDRLHLIGNPRLESLAAATTYLTTPEGIYWRPLVFLSYGVQSAFGTGSAAMLHLANAVLHGLNTALVFLVALRTGVPFAPAVTGAALFAWHPLQTEAVAYVSGRTDLLMTTAALAAFLLIVNPRRGADSRGEAIRSVAIAVATAAAIGAKESAYALPLLVAWLAYRHRASWQGRLALAAPSLAVGVAMLVARPAALPPLDLDVSALLANAGRTALEYGRLLLWPSGLQVDRLTPAPAGLLAIAVYSAVALGLAGAVVVGLRRRGPAGDWTAWSAASYLPVANLLPIYPEIASRALFTPEHNLYAPLAGLAMLAAMGFWRGAERAAAPRLAAVALAAVLVGCGARSWARVHEWRDEATLFGGAAAAGSWSPRVWYNLGNAAMAAGRHGEAAAAYQRALGLSPGDADAWMNLGVVLQVEGRLDEAQAAYERALALGPSPQLYRNLASLHLARGDEQAARGAMENVR